MTPVRAQRFADTVGLTAIWLLVLATPVWVLK